MAYQDLLKDTSKPDPSNKDYFLVTLTDIEVSQSYPIQFRWKYNDGTFSPWSAVKVVTTPGESSPNTPSTLTVVGGAGFLTVTWDGNISTGAALTNFDRVDIYVNGAPFNGSKPADSFFSAGTKTITAPAGTYIVSSYAVSKSGKSSAMSAAVTRTVTANVPAALPSLTPSTPTASSVLGAIQLSWNGKTSTNTDQPYGFNAAKVYVGTSAGFTPINTGTAGANQVDVLNFANGQNTLNIGLGTLVNGVALDHGIDYYIKIATTNGTDTSTAVSATGNPVRVGQVQNGSLITVTADKIDTGTLSSGSIITVGSTAGKHVKLSGTGDPLTIYGSGGTANPVLSFNGAKLSIVGDGTFSGNLVIGSTSTASVFKAEPATGIWLGDQSYSSAPFSVAVNGVIKANSGTIGGWTLGSSFLQGSNFEINSSNSTIYVGPTSGSHIRISASNGIATYNGGTQTSGFNLATNGTLSLSGAITATSGSFTGSVITSNILATGGTVGGWTLSPTSISAGGTTLSSNGYLSFTNAGPGALVLNQATIFESAGTAGTPAGSLTFSTSNSPRQIHFFDQNDLSGIVSINKQLNYPGISTGTGSTVVYLSSSGRIGYTTSSRKFKNNILQLQSGTYVDKVIELDPVSFDWIDQPEDMPYKMNYGLIAEDVSEIPVMDSIVNYNENNEPVSISYERLTPFLVMAIKEIAARLDALEG